jgi:glycosyltransferase involved in cell wall biosynthesis
VKIVMLVDNGVEGDSRVQKTARSAAEAGHDVTLLGISPTSEPRSWRIGAAEVRLLPLPGGSGSASGGLRARLLQRGGLPLHAARLARRPVEYARLWYWRLREGNRSWRHLEPGLWNYERAAGPTIDELRPDLIYANDFRMLGVGARAKERLGAKLIWDAHEFLPGIKPRRDNAYWLPAHCAYEREYAPAADVVVTTSESMADLLRNEHNLPTQPAVVLNAPDLTPADDGEVPDLRKLCGVGENTPLIVYSGSASVQRGLDTVVDALALLPGVHLALVVDEPDAPHVRALVSRNERVHTAPYVPFWQVVPYLSAADAGAIPIHHWPNHELALITKFFEYSHARLPIIVSDVKTMAAMVRQTGQGEVFRARDVGDCAAAIRKVLSDPQRYRAAYDKPDMPLGEWTWAAQAAKLETLYRSLAPSVEESAT